MERNGTALPFIVTRLRAGGRGFYFRQGRKFLFPTTPISALGLTQPYIRCTGIILPKVERSGRDVTSHLYLLLLGTCGAIPPLPIHLHDLALNQTPGKTRPCASVNFVHIYSIFRSVHHREPANMFATGSGGEFWFVR
jgi:hypothetical protein